MSETYSFKAEIRQLLHILVHSLYTEREIFLRELISNSSDALNRIQFEMLTNRNVVDPDEALKIHIHADPENRILTISDTGIGMTREEVIENLGTISKSGVAAFLKQVGENGQKITTDVIGQFGVGFYSIFMVADEVRVTSRSYKPEAEAVTWISRGEENFEVEIADKTTRGTEVVLHLKEDAAEFLQDYRLRQIVRKHSNYIAFPITLSTSHPETEEKKETEDRLPEPINEQQAIWRRPASEVEAQDYDNFYRSLTMDFKEPLIRIHSAADAPVQYYALLFIPDSRERNMFSTRQEPGLQLYARKVLIQDFSTDLLPEYLNFIQGVVDCEDLPLNVSRETVQANKVMAGLKKALTGRVLRELKEIAESDAEKYGEFWNEFGGFVKQGMLIEPANRDRLMPLLRFYSTHSEDQLTSLMDYAQRMQEVEGQEEIYYVLGDSQTVASRSPHLEPFRQRGIEVLYFTETVDSFLINSLFDYNGHKLRNIDDENLDLSAVGKPSETADAGEQLEDEALERVRERFAGALGERVHSVRISKVLTGNSPARLVSPEGTLDRHTQRVYKMLDRDYEVPRKILEINPRHALLHNVEALLDNAGESALVDLIIEQIYENALLLDGLHPDPAGMVDRIQALMEAASRHN